QLPKLMFEFPQGVTQTTNCVSPNWARRYAPFQKCFLRARDRFVVIVVGSRADAGQSSPVDRRNLFDLRAAPAPFAVKNAGVFVREPQFFQNCFHKKDGAVILSGAKNLRSFLRVSKRGHTRAAAVPSRRSGQATAGSFAQQAQFSCWAASP